MRSSRSPVLASLLAVLVVLAALVAPVAGQSQRHGLDPANMDPSVAPGQDFYRFANGGWLDRTTIPSDEARYGVFDELNTLTRQQLLGVLRDAAGSDLQEGSDTWKAAELFRQGTDMETRNAQGIAPIQPILDEIAAIQTVEELNAFQRQAVFASLTGLFEVDVDADLHDSATNAAYLSSSFLGLPNRDYYLDDDASSEEIRRAYIAAVAELLGYAGYDDAQAQAAAQAVYDLERSLAEPTLPREQQQEPALIYNPMTVAELSAAYPLMDWDAYLAELGLTGVDTLIVTEKPYLESLAGIVQATPLQTLKDFYTAEVLWTFAGYLDYGIGKTAFAFTGGVLSGVTEQRPLEIRTLTQTSSLLGDALGRLYVDAYFPPEAKAQITELVDAEIAAFRLRIEGNAWMSEETKAKAIEKLDAVQVKVGYPDRWRGYEAVAIGDSYAMSFLSAANAETTRQLAKAGQPVDRSEWGLSPQTVNAYYNPLLNEIVFPAAILQPPYFDYQSDAASNFGGIGFVIGHELTHGFDITGSQFDAQGNLVDWWTAEDRQRFSALNTRVVDAYDAVEILPGLHVNGQTTVGENVADFGGLQIAYDALQIHLAGERATASPAPLASPVAATEAATPLASPVAGIDIAALTPEQRFFLSAATVWRQKIRDAALASQVRTDEHPPARLRATIPLQQMDAFYAAFDIGPGDAMYIAPEDRIVIW